MLIFKIKQSPYKVNKLAYQTSSNTSHFIYNHFVEPPLAIPHLIFIISGMNDRNLNRNYPARPPSIQLAVPDRIRPRPNGPSHNTPSSSPKEGVMAMSIERRIFRTFDELEETPAFTTQFAQMCFDEQESSENFQPVNLGEAALGQSRSQSMAFQESSHLMENISRNFKRNFQHLQLRRLKNRLDELRNGYEEVRKLVGQQAEMLKPSLQQILAEVTKWTKRIIHQYSGQLSQQQQTIQILQGKLKEREYENSKLKKQAQGSKEKSPATQKSQVKRTISYQSRSSLGEVCLNCKTLQTKCDSLKEETAKLQKQIEALAVENQKLQEKMFDMQQQIVGIDLEVQKRLGEHINSLGNLAIPKVPSTKKENQDMLEVVRKLNEENGQLQKKCEQLQKRCLKEHDLKQLEAKLARQQQDYKRKQDSLLQSLAQHEKQKEKLYEKEHYIMIAQENIDNKLKQILKKQEELNSMSLHNKSQDKTNILLLPSVQDRNMEGDFLTDGLNSFGKIDGKLSNQNSGFMHTTQKYERTHSEQVMFVPPLPLKDNEAMYRVKTEYLNDIQFQDLAPRSSWRNYKATTAYPKRPQEKSFMGYRNERKVSPGRDRFQINSGKYQTHTPNSPMKYRETSQNSKVGTTKATRLVTIGATAQQIRERTQVAGLSSKLDKLRLQIKREMDAIR